MIGALICPPGVGDPLLRADCRPRDVVDGEPERVVEGVPVARITFPPSKLPSHRSATVSAAWLSNIVPALSAAVGSVRALAACVAR